ncbi:GNAT family N-acetyltransferase [Priestia megaterium]|uniref:GNAT family N-acetyltransferase n=1 Tax=Priestia megaterium TaxID=1404 RepID=UPI002D7FBFD9|nr:GNAT family N-acetyltransferase [Priestia megaterium]MEB4860896.1 GNAT family N-acetyltransferase [Priestia megaterium]
MVTIIREATLNDVRDIAALCSQLGYSVKEEAIYLRLKKLLTHKEHAVFIHESSDSVITGWVHILGKTLLELEYAEIGGLVVDKQARRQGIGEQLMMRCQEWAKANDFLEIRLRSGIQREEAHSFYSRIGYQNINQQRLFRLKL